MQPPSTRSVFGLHEHGFGTLVLQFAFERLALGFAAAGDNHMGSLFGVPWSVVSRPLAGDTPTKDLVVGYSKANNSPVLQLSRVGDLIGRVTATFG